MGLVGLFCCWLGASISEMVGTLMSGTLMTGIGGASVTSIEGAETSMAGADTSITGARSGFGWSLGFQVWSKLTIGRPTRSLTAEGIGSFSLRSPRLLLVAARISSLRISLPSLVGTG